MHVHMHINTYMYVHVYVHINVYVSTCFVSLHTIVDFIGETQVAFFSRRQYTSKASFLDPSLGSTQYKPVRNTHNN